MHIKLQEKSLTQKQTKCCMDTNQVRGNLICKLIEPPCWMLECFISLVWLWLNKFSRNLDEIHFLILDT